MTDGRYPKKIGDRLDALEQKGVVRRVRSDAGVAKYKQPKGSIILPGSGGGSMPGGGKRSDGKRGPDVSLTDTKPRELGNRTRSSSRGADGKVTRRDGRKPGEVRDLPKKPKPVIASDKPDNSDGYASWDDDLTPQPGIESALTSTLDHQTNNKATDTDRNSVVAYNRAYGAYYRSGGTDQAARAKLEQIRTSWGLENTFTDHRNVETSNQFNRAVWQKVNDRSYQGTGKDVPAAPTDGPKYINDKERFGGNSSAQTREQMKRSGSWQKSHEDGYQKRWEYEEEQKQKARMKDVAARNDGVTVDKKTAYNVEGRDTAAVFRVTKDNKDGTVSVTQIAGPSPTGKPQKLRVEKRVLTENSEWIHNPNDPRADSSGFVPNTGGAITQIDAPNDEDKDYAEPRVVPENRREEDAQRLMRDSIKGNGYEQDLMVLFSRGAAKEKYSDDQAEGRRMVNEQLVKLGVNPLPDDHPAVEDQVWYELLSQRVRERNNQSHIDPFDESEYANLAERLGAAYNAMWGPTDDNFQYRRDNKMVTPDIEAGWQKAAKLRIRKANAHIRVNPTKVYTTKDKSGTEKTVRVVGDNNDGTVEVESLGAGKKFTRTVQKKDLVENPSSTWQYEPSHPRANDAGFVDAPDKDRPDDGSGAPVLAGHAVGAIGGTSKVVLRPKGSRNDPSLSVNVPKNGASALAELDKDGFFFRDSMGILHGGSTYSAHGDVVEFGKTRTTHNIIITNRNTGDHFEVGSIGSEEDAQKIAAAYIMDRRNRLLKYDDSGVPDAWGRMPRNNRPRDFQGFKDYDDGVRGLDWEEPGDPKVDFTSEKQRRESAMRELDSMGIKLYDKENEDAVALPTGSLRDNKSRHRGHKVDTGALEQVNRVLRTHENMYPGISKLFDSISVDGDMSGGALAYNWQEGPRNLSHRGNRAGVAGVLEVRGGTGEHERSTLGLPARYFGAGKRIPMVGTTKRPTRDNTSEDNWKMQALYARPRDKDVMPVGEMSVDDTRLREEGDENWERNTGIVSTMTHEIGHTIGYMLWNRLSQNREVDTRPLTDSDPNLSSGNYYRRRLLETLDYYGVMGTKVNLDDHAQQQLVFEKGTNVQANELNHSVLAEHLSRYGATNYQELMAETWAAYQLDDTPGDFVREVGKIMEDALQTYLADEREA